MTNRLRAGADEGQRSSRLGSSWQRCRVHYTRNAQDLVPRSARSMVASAIRLVFEQPGERSARGQVDAVLDGLRPRFAPVADLLADAEPDLLAHFAFPETHRAKIRSTNPLVLGLGRARRPGAHGALGGAAPAANADVTNVPSQTAHLARTMADGGVRCRRPGSAIAGRSGVVPVAALHLWPSEPGAGGALVTALPRVRSPALADEEAGFSLDDGSRVAVIGSGPAGSLFSYFLLRLADTIGVNVGVDIYEPRAFATPGPIGCNMCGGIISETLVQNLAVDGVNLPPGVVQRGIDSYVLHTDVGSVRISTPSPEMRIGAVHRGAGPRDLTEAHWESFDEHLQSLALESGAQVIQTRVEEVTRDDGHPVLRRRDGTAARYDLVVVATGVNTSLLKTFEGLGIGYERPKVTKTLIREYYLGEEAVTAHLGTSMHVFLLDLPRLEFAALIPKGDYVTMCLLGEDIDNSAGDAFAGSPEVRAVMPPGWNPDERSCQCLPHINVHGVAKPFADRIVFIGDSGVTRLYKDGIGAAYRTAKAAARVALLEGVSEAAFQAHYLPVCRSIMGDNRVGGLAFLLTRLAKNVRPLRRLILSETRREQRNGIDRRLLSGVLWDMFSGSAPYSDIFRRMLSPRLMARFLIAAPGAVVPLPGRDRGETIQ